MSSIHAGLELAHEGTQRPLRRKKIRISISTGPIPIDFYATLEPETGI